MKGYTDVNLLRKGNNVYVLNKALEGICLGRLGCLKEVAIKLRKTKRLLGYVNPLLKSRLKSKAIGRQGYLILKNSELKRICKAHKWGMILED